MINVPFITFYYSKNLIEIHMLMKKLLHSRFSEVEFYIPQFFI